MSLPSHSQVPCGLRPPSGYFDLCAPRHDRTLAAKPTRARWDVEVFVLGMARHGNHTGPGRGEEASWTDWRADQR